MFSAARLKRFLSTRKQAKRFDAFRGDLKTCAAWVGHSPGGVVSVCLWVCGGVLWGFCAPDLMRISTDRHEEDTHSRTT